jgi:hypothetical protein
MMRKFGLLMLSWTLWKRFWTACWVDRCPQMRYLLWPLTEICDARGQRSKAIKTMRRETDLASDRDLGHLLETDGRLRRVRVVEDDGDRSAGHAGLTTLVDQVEQVGGADLRKEHRQLATAEHAALIRTVVKLVIPRTKQIASRMLDLPEPFLRGVVSEVSFASPSRTIVEIQ